MEGKPRSLYFSAYRLKTLEESIITENGGSEKSPYLKLLLSRKPKTTNKVRVFPMINPYKQRDTETNPSAVNTEKDLTIYSNTL